ncbi:E3 ubiquitin-protein ligase TRIM39-like [Bufo bufo]|uniref:E3 ubiquitin-protein ligase TRIM39-like n=1 Tax=Bufo bufo TaxID=8384 RepID=UPI001ABE06A5|nr:E3 ubiquitin-protein ligase TRIM39-like [Bufo bufo]XP_040281822.1 E3 ubiquitin-protein ligase TRIM39-like [Bufo bufo]
MASARTKHVKDLQEELTCSICLDKYKDPVSIQCGHNFCRACISQTWKGTRSNFLCPVCRKVSKWKFLRPNRVVGNVLEISAQMFTAVESEGPKKQCPKHQEPLKLYCKDDSEEICVVCRESVYHRSHTVMPVEETTEEFKGEVQNRLQALRKELANSVQLKTEEKERAQELQAEVLQKRQMVTAGFEGLRQLLADEETVINHRLENLERAIKQRRNECVSRLNEKVSSLQKVITDLEKSFLISNSHNCQEQKASVGRHSPELPHPKHRIPRHTGRRATLDFFMSLHVPLSLDLKTVNQNLLVTCNRQRVKYVEDALHLAPCPERFDSKPCVLATTGFKLGKHYWEVEVGGGIYWTTGIAKQSVCRKGMFRIEPGRGIWAIGLLGMYTDRYYAFTNPDTLLNPKEQLERVGVFLNCDESYVSFYNALNLEHLYTFNFMQVPEKMFPFFCVGALGTELKLN